MNIMHRAINFLIMVVVVLPMAVRAEQFSIVIIPDTQIYVEVNPEIFEAQTQWIVDNQIAENIIYVAHLGDLKDDLSCDNKTVNAGTGAGRTEWDIVDDTLTTLENANIAYGVVPGNHDFDQLNGTCPNFTTQRPLSLFNQNLGPTRFNGQPYYGDPALMTPGNRVIASNEDNFTLFAFGNTKFIAINLAYKQAANPVNDDAEVDWADALLKQYPDRLGLITNHYFIEENPAVGGGGPFNNFGPYGQEIYDALSDNPNLFMMLSAHRFGEAWRVEDRSGDSMQPVQALLSDYQRVQYPLDLNNIDYDDLNGSFGNGNSGFMRIMRFDTVTGMVNIETFAPEVPFLGRNIDLVSDYFPADGSQMDKDTASNLSFSYQGYAITELPPFEMLGLRDFSGTGNSVLLLTFGAVKAGTEDRTIVHFDISSLPNGFSSASLNIGVNNIDPGLPAGTLDVFSFAGDGTVSLDEWNSGAAFHTFGGIGGDPVTLTVDITALLSTAITNGDNFLSFRLSTTDPDRFWLNDTKNGVSHSISGEGPTFLEIVP